MAPAASPRAGFWEETLNEGKSTERLSSEGKVLLSTPAPRAALTSQSTFPKVCFREKSTEVAGFGNGVKISEHGMPKI